MIEHTHGSTGICGIVYLDREDSGCITTDDLTRALLSTERTQLRPELPPENHRVARLPVVPRADDIIDTTGLDQA